MPRLTPELRAAIVRAAEEDGVDPATALAYAERESSFNPQARNSKTIRGLYQMRGDLRSQYGVGDSDDPYTQTKGFNRLLADNRGMMSKRLGRDVSDSEAYAGHHFGAGRAATMFRMAPDTSVAEVFTRREMAENPHFAKAGTVGNLLTSITGDIDKRRATHGGSSAPALDFAAFGEAVEQPDYAPMGEPSNPGGKIDMVATAPESMDFSQFGEVA